LEIKLKIAKLVTRLSVIVLISVFLLNLPVILRRQSTIDYASDNKTDTSLSEINSADKIEAIDDLLTPTKEQRKIELERQQKEAEFNARVAAAENILNRYGSPMAGYGNIIVQKADECGGDYKILLAIAGNESGFGKIPYKLYNPYGYLDGIQYSGWEESLSYLSCVISQRFIDPCGGDIVCIESKYGGSDTAHEKWIWNINFFIKQI
jgi:hypothetical protein